MPADKRKSKNRLNKTRVKHLHKSAVHIKMPEFAIKICVGELSYIPGQSDAQRLVFCQ